MFSTNRIQDAWKALGVYVTLNAVFGLWPLHEINLLVKTLWFVPTAEMVVMLMTSVYEMYFTCESADFSIDILVIISFGLVGLAKLIFYHANRDSLRLNVESAIDDWTRAETSAIDSIRCTFRKIYQRLTRIYVAIGMTAAFMYPLKVYYFERDAFIEIAIRTDQQTEPTVPILKKRFIFPSVCSFNDVSQTLYLIINVHQFFQFFVCVGVNLSADCFFITITYHLCGQFEILKRGFASFQRLKTEARTRREYGVLVARHKHLLKLAKCLERSLNMIVFTQIIVNIILFNIAGINFVIHLKRKEGYGALSPFGILVFTLMQTFMYAHVGDNVSSVIEEITRSIYEGPWRTMSPSMAKDVILLMTLSNTSIHLTADQRNLSGNTVPSMSSVMATELWNDDASYEFMVYKLIMWPLGLWPLHRGHFFSDVRLVIAALTQAATSISLTTEILLNCHGFENALDLLVLDIFASLACAKGIIVRLHRNEMYRNVTSALRDWYASTVVENPKYREIMTRHARTGRIVCFSLMGPASGGTLSWIILALPLSIFNFNPNATDLPMRNFPLQTACTFEAASSSFFLYHAIFLLQMVQLVATCLGNCGNDVFFFGIAMHVCGQFEILKIQFSTIGMNDGDEKITRNRLVELAKTHAHLIELVDDLESTFHLIILAQLAMSALLICIMGVQVIIAMKTDDVFTGMKASIVLSSLMSQLFLYSYAGDCLTSQNEELGQCVYESIWYNLTPRTAKNLIFVMMRANKPIRVTAGKFFVMTLGTFMDILKIAVSYMSFLRVMIDI